MAEYTDDLYVKDTTVSSAFIEEVANQDELYILRSEMESAIRKLSDQKAAGGDGILAELLKQAVMRQ